MSDLVSSDPGLSVFFTVEVDGVQLGSWTTCTGLGIEIETEHRADSSMTILMHHLPGRIKYTNLVVSRPISTETPNVISWIQAFSTLPVPTTAEVKALDPSGSTITSWSLFGVQPVRWTGPSFDAAQLQVAKEELEISYQGFM